MFFKKKKEEKAPEGKALLYRENIRVNCEAQPQEEVIRQVGQMLVDSGYVDQPYVEAMLEREKSFSTFMGNGLALPHGVEDRDCGSGRRASGDPLYRGGEDAG